MNLGYPHVVSALGSLYGSVLHYGCPVVDGSGHVHVVPVDHATNGGSVGGLGGRTLCDSPLHRPEVVVVVESGPVRLHLAQKRREHLGGHRNRSHVGLEPSDLAERSSDDEKVVGIRDIIANSRYNVILGGSFPGSVSQNTAGRGIENRDKSVFVVSVSQSVTGSGAPGRTDHDDQASIVGGRLVDDSSHKDSRRRRHGGGVEWKFRRPFLGGRDGSGENPVVPRVPALGDLDLGDMHLEG
mmetsp:Transcript_25280/g.59590  ORF Transcript_25280/g.59590 Transcript_25280/m.59590 type:complete len:241 (+) Transcript_25280:4270-4992(+)